MPLSAPPDHAADGPPPDPAADGPRPAPARLGRSRSSDRRCHRSMHCTPTVSEAPGLPAHSNAHVLTAMGSSTVSIVCPLGIENVDVMAMSPASHDTVVLPVDPVMPPVRW